MPHRIREQLKDFAVIGLSYKKSSVEIREKFSLSPKMQEHLLEDAKQYGVDSLVILSTCNRTELYAHTSSLTKLIYLFIHHCNGSMEDFDNFGYLLRAHEAVQHLFRVANGLDSQILGDAQIIHQIKNAFKLSRSKNMLNPFTNRLSQFINQSSKKVKNHTTLSSGAASVAYAAVQFIRKENPILEDKKILLIGAGEIGQITCENLIKYTHPSNITVLNRTEKKALILASKLGINTNPFALLPKSIEESHIIIVATGANQPVLNEDHLPLLKDPKVLLDLSIPRNIAPVIYRHPLCQVIGVDELSQESQSVIAHREEAIPLAEAIIDNTIKDFYNWLRLKHLSPIFQELQSSLGKIKQREMDYHKGKIPGELEPRVNQITQNIVDHIAENVIEFLKENYNIDMPPVKMVELLNSKLKEEQH